MTKLDVDKGNYGTIFKGTYMMIRDKWRYTARISYLLEMVQYSYGIDEWDVLDTKDMSMISLENLLVNFYIDYNSGKDIDFKDLWERIKKTVSFSKKEVSLLEEGSIDERLWAIFTAILNPSLEIKY